MPTTKKVLAFDVDASSLATLREALPEWEIQNRPQASATSLTGDETIEAADLLVLGAQDDVRRTLALCRGLRRESGRGGPSLLVLAPADQPGLVREVQEAGADHCLVLPINVKHLAGILRAHEGDALASQGKAAEPSRAEPSRAEPSRAEDRWQDEGGQG